MKTRDALAIGLALALGAPGTGGAATISGASFAAAAVADSVPHGRRALVEVGLPRPVPTRLDSVPHPWPGRALFLSTVGTALPIAIAGQVSRNSDGATRRQVSAAAVAVEVVSPSAGHLYAGLSRRALTGVMVRAVGAALVWGGAAAHGSSDEFDWGIVQVLAGGTIMATSALVDVITVAPDVERRNQQWLRDHPHVSLVPHDAAGHPALAVAVRF